MLDTKLIRENPEILKKALKNRGADFDVDYLLELDQKRRLKIKEVDDLRARQNALAEEVARSMAGEREKKIEESKGVKAQLGDLEFESKVIEEEFNELSWKIPNSPLDEVPVGKGEADNVVLREVGERPKFSFPPTAAIPPTSGSPMTL